MKKIFLFLALTFIFSSFASAQVNEYNYFKLGELDSNTNLVRTTTPVSGVNIRGFICSNAACSGTLGDLWGGELYTSTDGINLIYPTVLQSPYGYAFLVYKDGYVPYWVKGVTWYGTGTVRSINRYPAKKQVCIADVSIVDTSQTIRDLDVDVRVNSPIVNKYGSMYIPSEVRPHLNTLTDVHAEIRNDGGSLIWSDDSQVNLHYSEVTTIPFSINDLDDGNYTFTVSTSSENEPKCSDYELDSDSFEFGVYEDLFPSASASADPLSGTFPLDVSFSCQGTGGNGALTYFWDFDDGSTSTLQNPEHTYLEAGNFTASCRVRDADGDEAFAYVGIEVGTKKLEIDSLICFDEVIEGHNQSCSVSVTDSLGGVTIDIFYSDDSFFGTCLTNEITGACGAKDLQELVGNFEVYATASKTGYLSDNDGEPRFNYNVLKEEYDILALKVYNDSIFTLEDYDFFRGENMFVSFEVEDSSGNPVIEDLISSVSLISSLAGGRVELEKIEKIGNTYYYKLIPIPITHDFIGDSTVFAFVFNIANNSGGQEEVSLMIRNNLPVVSPEVPLQTVKEEKDIDLDLELHETDVEDSGNDLRWELMSFDSGIDVTLTGKILNIEGLDEGDSEIVLRLFDLDNDYAEVTVEVLVEGKKKPSTTSSGGCRNEWECSAWSECEDGAMTRNCIDRKYCSKEKNKPIEFQSCFDEGALLYAGTIDLGNASFNEKSSSDLFEKLTVEDFIWILIFLILVITFFLIWILWARF